MHKTKNEKSVLIRLAVLALLVGMTLLLINGSAAGSGDDVEGQTLLSNTDQPRYGASSLDIKDQAQAFGIGSGASGYMLTAVRVPIVVNNDSGANDPTYTVTIVEGFTPDATVVATLDPPDSLSDGLNTFTLPEWLELSTGFHWLVFNVSSKGDRAPAIALTSSSNYTSIPGPTWYIAGSSERSIGSSTWVTSNVTRQIELVGISIPSDTPTEHGISAMPARASTPHPGADGS